MKNEDTKMESEAVAETPSPVTDKEASKTTNVPSETETASSEKSTQNGALQPNKIPENSDNQTIQSVEETEPKITENGDQAKTEQADTEKQSEKPGEEKQSEKPGEEKPSGKPGEEKQSEKPEEEKLEQDNAPVEVTSNVIETTRVTRGAKRKANHETIGEEVNVTITEHNDDLHLTEEDLKSSSNVMGKGRRARVPNKRYSDILLTPGKRAAGTAKVPLVALEESLSIKEELLGDFAGFDSAVTAAAAKKSKAAPDLQVPLGLNDPDKEIVRPAASAGRRSTSSRSATRKSDSLAVGATLTTSGLRRRTTIGVINATQEKEKESTSPNSSRNKRKSLLKKGKTSTGKKDLSTVAEPMEVDIAPSKSSVVKTRNSGRQSIQATNQPKGQTRSLKSKSLASNTNCFEGENIFMGNYMQNISFGYSSLLYIFQYLKVQDLLSAGCVCTMWRDIASNPVLWRTVRMKNSQVYSFEGLTNTLKKYNTVNLDLRKTLLPNNGDEIWLEFSETIGGVQTLRKIEFCRCPAFVIEQLPISNSNLKVINAIMIKSDIMNFDAFSFLSSIVELKIKAISSMTVNSILSLKDLKTLKVLALTSVLHLSKLELSVLAELTNLESLDLGECTGFPGSFGQDVLIKLEKLEKLRLEKGQDDCNTFEILKTVKDMKKLEQLELINFDIKSGFDKAIGACVQLKKLMIIPTYVSQSATTNNMVLSGVLRLQGTLTHFVWGVTLELIRVTELFIDQCDQDKKNKNVPGSSDSIPVLKPVPDLSNGGIIEPARSPSQVEILPLPNLQKLLLNSLPSTRVKILKIPFHATWRQSLHDSAYL